jgi:ABC-type nitrate/sulfonate/bicarbonate transport system substrate-binding protein
MSTFIIQPHGRLQEWVAEEQGYFKDEGLEYQFTAPSLTTHDARSNATVVNTDQAPVARAEIRSGAFEDMEAGRTCNVSSACHWAVNAAAGSNHGRMYGHAYSLSPAGIFVAPESDITTPEDLAGVEVGVGYHSGSHYSALQAVEQFLTRDQINLKFIGRPNDRIRLLLSRQIPAVNVFSTQYYLAEQQGFRKIVDTSFMMGFLLTNDANMDDTEMYFRALRRAQADIDLEPEKYKHYYLREMAPDLAALSDVRRFGTGERIVFEPYTREMFDKTQRWMRGWELFGPDQLSEAKYEVAVLA